MRVYLDSSALLKRVFAEPESRALVSALRQHVHDGLALVSSSLAWVEVSRAARGASGGRRDDVDDWVEVALSGVAERPITPDVVALARRLDPSRLRSLDAIHLASALVVDADVVVVYDERLLAALAAHGIRSVSPGS